MKPPSRPLPRRARLALLALGVLLVLALSAELVASALFPPRRLTPLVRSQLARRLHAPVSLAEARLRLFPLPTLELEDIAIGDVSGFERPASRPRGILARADLAIASLAWGPLLGRRIEVRAARLVRPRVTLVRNGDGRGNWEGLGGPAQPSGERARASGFDVTIRRFALERGSLSYFDGRDSTYLTVRSLDHQLRLDTQARGERLHVEARAAIQGLGGQRPWPIGEEPIEIAAELDHDRGRQLWRLELLTIRRGDLVLEGDGEIAGAERVLALRLATSQVGLGEVLELVPRDRHSSLEDLRADGHVQLALRADGPLAGGQTLRVRARARLADGRLEFRGRPRALEDLAFDVIASEDGADLTILRGRVGRSPFEASAKLRDWRDPRAWVKLRTNADLADVRAFLPMADSTQLSGQVQLAVEGAGRIPRASSAATGAAPAAPLEFGWTGRADLRAVSLAGTGMPWGTTKVQGTIGLDPGRAWATGLGLRLGRSDVTVDATIIRPFEFFAALGGHPERGHPDAVARFAARSREIVGDELIPPGPATTPLPRVRAEGTVAIGHFTFRRLEGRRATFALDYANGVTRLQDGVLDAYGGRARGHATFDWRDRARPIYLVEAQAESLEANALLSAWTPAKDVAFGTMQLTLRLAGQGTDPAELRRNLTAQGLAQLAGGQLAGAQVFAELAEFTGVNRFRILSFRDLVTPFRIERGRVFLKELTLATGATDWFAAGSVGLDGTLDFHVTALVPAANAAGLPAALRTAAGALLDPSGRMSLDFQLGGTVRDPRFSWDAGRPGQRLLARAEDVIEARVQTLADAITDSLASQRAELERRAAEALAEQRRRLEAEAARRTRELERGAVEKLTDLFTKRAPPPGSAGADTVPGAPPAPSAAPDTAAIGVGDSLPGG